MKNYRIILIIGLIVLLLIDIGLAYQSYQKSKTPSYETILVKRGEIRELVSSTGTVEPASQINLQFTSTGRITEVNVKTGDKVLSGQILASLDSGDLFYQAQSAEAALQNAKAKLAQLLAGATAEELALAQTAVSNAQKNLEDAKKALTDAQATADNSLKDVYEDIQRTLDASLLTLQNSLKTNSDTLDSTKLAPTISVLDYQALVDAKILKNLAELDYQPAKTAVEQSKLTQSQSDIDLVAEKLKKALNSGYSALSRTYDVLVATVISSSLSQTDLDTYKTNIATARTNINTALTNIITDQQDIAGQKLTNQSNLTVAQTSVTQAEGALATARDQLALKQAKPRQIDIDLYQAQVSQAQANLNQIRYQISQKSLSAPIDGIITDVLIEKGEIASLSLIAISMNSLSNFEIKSDIAESDIAKIDLGNSVEITFDAFGENEKWEGKVIKIDPAQTIVQGVVYYKITVGLAINDQKIKSGMTANLETETARHENTLIVPTRAIQESDSKKTVKILTGKEIKEVVVQAGLKNTEGEIEIISGLKEGDQVVIETK